MSHERIAEAPVVAPAETSGALGSDNLEDDTSPSSLTDDDEPGYLYTVPPDPRRMDPIDNPRFKEEGCTVITEQKKYYEFDNVFIKRNLVPSEYIVNRWGHLVLPYKCKERIKNEAAVLKYIQANTAIPVPNVRCAFEDRGRYYLMTDIVPGVVMAELSEDKKAVVIKEVEGYVAQMHSIKSNVMGGLAGDVILPYRLSEYVAHDDATRYRDADGPEFVLCHNDLSQHNILVDEGTLKVTAILDWEYAGFFPPEFDGKFYLRPGPSVALEGEQDDIADLFAILDYWQM